VGEWQVTLPTNRMRVDYWVLLFGGVPGVLLLGYIGKKILFVVFGSDRDDARSNLNKELKDYNPGLEVGDEIGEKLV
jgi:hypothetical protein